MTRRARDTNQDMQGMKSRTDCSGEKTSGALQCPQVLITPGLPARDDFQKTTNVVHGCICSLLRTWEAKQYSSTMRETDFNSCQEEDGWTKYSASLFALL